DGIRDFHVTGVQTCALPISPAIVQTSEHIEAGFVALVVIEITAFNECTELLSRTQQIFRIFGGKSNRSTQCTRSVGRHTSTGMDFDLLQQLRLNAQPARMVKENTGL